MNSCNPKVITQNTGKFALLWSLLFTRIASMKSKVSASTSATATDNAIVPTFLHHHTLFSPHRQNSSPTGTISVLANQLVLLVVDWLCEMSPEPKGPTFLLALNRTSFHFYRLTMPTMYASFDARIYTTSL